MDNKTAFWIAALVAAVFLSDALFFHLGLPVILGKILVRASDWLAFWR